VVGAGISYKQLKKNAVSVAFFGDGAMQQGIMYESMNMAALWDLPVMFVCINNQYGMGTRVDQATRALDFSQRATALGLAGASVDGEDVAAVFATAQTLIDGARAGRAAFLEVSCYRFFGHGRMDKSPYRSAAEEEAGRRRDPVAAARLALIERGVASEAALDALDAEVAREMDETLTFADRAPAPEFQAMFRDVYHPSQPEPEPLRARLDRILADG
jgi:pyruvate dehydrogenase E1 component alpha subunit